MESFIVSSFGAFVMRLVQGLFRVRSAQTFAVLACGWALAGRERDWQGFCPGCGGGFCGERGGAKNGTIE